MSELLTEVNCPSCGTPLSRDGRSQGLCPGCILELALESPSLMEELEATSATGLDSDSTWAYSAETPSLGEGKGQAIQSPSGASLAAAQPIGGRYHVRTLLGRGGMGEVWRAFDLKLRVDVALKVLRRQLIGDSAALELLRQEVRAAREVTSPNVCRVFDLIELDGQELVSMEYIDGITLFDILKARAPLDLAEAREIAAQFLAGLEAIHTAGLVHRDVKPENLMMTRSGRVVLMDFGIAKSLQEVGTSTGATTIAGTPAYMAPEQARGEELDARADVFSAGVVLAEMVAPGGLKTPDARQRIWKGIRQDPPEVGKTPWAGVLKKSVATDWEQRYPTASALARALEEVTLRAGGDDNLDPYPGLSSFTKEDAEYFFGRELEIEEMWKKLQRPHLLALIGPSGAGKSSFLRAGLLSVIPTGWRALVVTPGSRPFMALSQALVAELVGDTEALQLLTSPANELALVEAASRWRDQHDQALLILDQFEELFTQNPPETQERFASLLSHLALEADIHVLLSMRDDFLFHCTSQEALAPIYSELTPLKPLSGTALRRALVQPALKCGYRFEDDTLVDEMVAEVADERGALPLLAFAAARLWSLRDREQGLLTREAYEHIGGVGGALAQHAEQTLERIGHDQIPTVREIFRNLVTAQGTRLARGRDELLSVFVASGARYPAAQEAPVFRSAAHESAGDAKTGARSRPDHVNQALDQPSRHGDGTRADQGSGTRLREQSRPETLYHNRPTRDAATVLDALIDARLLTAYEQAAADDDAEPQQRIEIIHESLLSNWPRLVRWRTQDADSAQLRDQLRQAAQMWIERGRPEDLLWTGTSYKEYELWRERYEGGLSESEETFAEAMKTKAEHQKRRQRQRVVLAFVVLALVTIVISLLGWQAHLGRLLAEAQKLVALGQLELESSPTTTLAFATRSLELSDTEEARILALTALSKGPPVTTRPLQANEDGVAHDVTFSPDGSWAALSGYESLQVLGRNEGSHRILEKFPSGTFRVDAVFDASGRYLYGAKDGEIRIWSVPDYELLERQTLGGSSTQLASTGSGVLCYSELTGETVLWQVEIGKPPIGLGRLDSESLTALDVAPSGNRLAYADGNSLLLRSLQDWGEPPRTLGNHRESISWIAFHPTEDRLLAFDRSGEIRIWSIDSELGEPLSIIDASDLSRFAFDPSGRRLAGYKSREGLDVKIWSFDVPPEALPVGFSAAFPGTSLHNGSSFSPDGRWLATAQVGQVGFWAMVRDEPYTLVGPKAMLVSLEFTPDGRNLISRDIQGSVRLWPLSADTHSRILTRAFSSGLVAVDPLNRFVATPDTGGAQIVPLDGSATTKLEGFDPRTWVVGIAIDPTSRFVAASPNRGPARDKVIRIWDLESGEASTLGPLEGAGEGFDGQTLGLAFLPDGSLLSAGSGGLHRWNLRTGQPEEILGQSLEQADLEVFGNGRFVAHRLASPEGSHLAITDLEARSTRILPEFGNRGGGVAVDPTGTVIATMGSRGIQVRLLSPGAGGSDEPHLLLGHDEAWVVAISPDGAQVASASADGTIRVWPLPDLSQPPLQALPHDELLDKLSTLTNLQVVEDGASSTGWKVETGPFPGWEEVPTW